MLTAALLLPFALFAALLAARVAARRGRRGISRRGFVSASPEWQAWLRRHRLTEPADFLALTPLVVSGHPGREVGRVTLGDGDDARTFYLKREHSTPLLARVVHFLAGNGFVSRSVREADLLAALERDGLPAPAYVACGEDRAGRAFLLVEAVADAEPLAVALAKGDFADRRRLCRGLGAALASLHRAGFFHRDLYAKHVLVRGDGSFVLLDWQRAWRGAWTSHASRVRDLAALHATVADCLASPRDRLALLAGYLGSPSNARTRAKRRVLIGEAERLARKMQTRRHIREKRQLPTEQAQAWIHLDGEALSITPALHRLIDGRAPEWLSLENQPLGSAPSARRWLVLPGRTQALLERRRDRHPLVAVVRHRLWGRPLLAPEQRRATLLWRLERHGVAAPRVLAMGRRDLAGGAVDSFLLSEPILGTASLGVWCRQSDADRVRRALGPLGRTLARLHDACCYLDGTGDPFGVRPDGAVVVAAPEHLRPLRKPDGARASADLARLRSELSRLGAAAEWPAVVAAYRESSRASDTTPGLPPDLSSQGRNMRTTIPSLFARLFTAWKRSACRADWPAFAGDDWLDTVMNAEVTDRFAAKQGRSTGRWILPARDGSGRTLSVYLKRHYKLPWLDGLRAALFPRRSYSPAMQEYDHLEWARSNGVPVPATVAAGEFLGPGGKLQSFLAVEELADMLPLNDAIPLAMAKQPPEAFKKWKRGLVAEMARLSRLLHDRRHFHKDLYLCHFYVHADHLAAVPADGWRGRVTLIDLHRLAHHPWTWWNWQLKDLAQLLYSSEIPGVDLADRVAFWRAYRGPGPQGFGARLLRWLVVWKWKRYRAHNLRMLRRRGAK